jgi:hypothetical protein
VSVYSKLPAFIKRDLPCARIGCGFDGRKVSDSSMPAPSFDSLLDPV